MCALYVLLGLASVGVALATRSRPASKLRQQVFSWWRIFPAVTLTLFLYPLGPVILVFGIGILALQELTPHQHDSPLRFRMLCLGLLGGAVLLSVQRMPLAMLVFPVLIAIQLALFWSGRQAHRLHLLLFLVLCYGSSFIIQFMYLPFPHALNSAWLFYLFALTALNDIGQFIFGTMFGRHKIAEAISPNKTWEGLGGGIAVSMLVSVSLGSYLQLAPMSRLVGFAVLLSVGGFCGDLLFSAAKRFFGIKDFSQLIPGHGGILDRVDSLVITAPLLYFAIYLSR